jgi:hypothetical protein
VRRLRHDTSGRLLAGLAVTVGLLVPLAVIGAPALARSAASASEYQYGHSSSAEYQYKIAVCHHTGSWKHPWHTIRISVRAWPAHERHGDTLGECGSEPNVVKHNHGRGHGAGSNAQGGDHGNGHGKGNGKGNGQGKGNGHGNGNGNGHEGNGD